MPRILLSRTPVRAPINTCCMKRKRRGGGVTPPPPGCCAIDGIPDAQTSLFTDDFTNPALPLWDQTITGTASITAAGGVLTILSSPFGEADLFAKVSSMPHFNALNDDWQICFNAQYSSPPGSTDGAYVGISDSTVGWSGASNTVGIGVDQFNLGPGVLQARYVIADNNGGVTEIIDTGIVAGGPHTFVLRHSAGLQQVDLSFDNGPFVTFVTTKLSSVVERPLIKSTSRLGASEGATITGPFCARDHVVVVP